MITPLRLSHPSQLSRPWPVGRPPPSIPSLRPHSNNRHASPRAGQCIIRGGKEDWPALHSLSAPGGRQRSPAPPHALAPGRGSAGKPLTRKAASQGKPLTRIPGLPSSSPGKPATPATRSRSGIRAARVYKAQAQKGFPGPRSATVVHTFLLSALASRLPSQGRLFAGFASVCHRFQSSNTPVPGPQERCRICSFPLHQVHA